MAKQVHVTLVDDIDGSPAASTVTFALEGRTYEVDLSEANAEALADALAPYIAVGRKVSRVTRTGATSRPKKSSRFNNTSEVREWAQQKGLKVSTRGRIPADIQAAYDRAHN